jgi:hypothetical protein
VRNHREIPARFYVRSSNAPLDIREKRFFLASVPSDAGADSGSSTAPITGLPNDVWTWVDFPDSVCANGTPTGIAINPHAGAMNLMIYFEGGGDCVDAACMSQLRIAFKPRYRQWEGAPSEWDRALAVRLLRRRFPSQHA